MSRNNGSIIITVATFSRGTHIPDGKSETQKVCMYIVVVKCLKDDPDFAYKAANTEMEGYRVSIIIAIATQLSEVGSGFMVSYDYCCRMQALSFPSLHLFSLNFLNWYVLFGCLNTHTTQTLRKCYYSTMFHGFQFAD